MTDSMGLLAVLLLIGSTAIFVAAEFAFVKVRTSRVEQLVSEGNRRALGVQYILNNLDGFLSACQVGITVSSLGLGWIGEPAVNSIIEPVISKLNVHPTIAHSLSFAIAFFLVTFLHVVFGEMAPKTVSIQKAEKVSMLLARPMILFFKFIYPLVWMLNQTAIGFVRIMGLKPANEHEETHSEEEIKLIVSSSSDINADEKSMLEKIFEFDDTVAKEIMVHRTDMVCVYAEDDWSSIMKTFKDSMHSRIPVCGVDRDDIRGYLNAKDVYSEEGERGSVERYMRKIPKIHESTPIKKALKKLQKGKHQIAIVYDEYGGVSGLVTLEDIVEEIVGDIHDEFDDDEPQVLVAETHVLAGAGVHVDDLKKVDGYDFPSSDGVHTIGGHLLELAAEEGVPKEGFFIDRDGYRFTVVEATEERIVKVRIEKASE